MSGQRKVNQFERKYVSPLDLERQVAAEVIQTHGVEAKAECMRQVLLARRDRDDGQGRHWQQVFEHVVEIEQQNPKIYDHLLSACGSPGDMVTAALNSASRLDVPPGPSEWPEIAAQCGAAATYLAQLEEALLRMVRDPDAAHLQAVAVLVKGPPSRN